MFLHMQGRDFSRCCVISHVLRECISGRTRPLKLKKFDFDAQTMAVL